MPTSSRLVPWRMIACLAIGVLSTRVVHAAPTTNQLVNALGALKRAGCVNMAGSLSDDAKEAVADMSADEVRAFFGNACNGTKVAAGDAGGRAAGRVATTSETMSSGSAAAPVQQPVTASGRGAADLALNAALPSTKRQRFTDRTAPPPSNVIAARS